MIRALILLILVSGCASVHPARPAGPRIDPPVPLPLALGPDALARFVTGPAGSAPRRAQWDASAREGKASVQARFDYDGPPRWSLILTSAADSLYVLNGRPGPSVGQWTSVWSSWSGYPSLTIRLRPDREVVLAGDSSGSAFAFVDLDGLAAATPADTAYVHPRTRAVRFGHVAADAYARAVRIVQGPVVLPDQLAALLPDTTGLGLPPRTAQRVETGWKGSDYPADGAAWSPEDLHRVDAAAVAALYLSTPDRGWAYVKLISLPDTPRSDEERADSDLTAAAFATLPSDPETWFTKASGGSTTAFRVGEDRFVVASGSNTAVTSALLKRLDVAALAALVPVPLWRPAGSAWEAGSTRTAFGGLVEGVGRVGVLTIDLQQFEDLHGSASVAPGGVTFSFALPDGWVAAATAEADCGGTDWGSVVALVTRVPTDPCRPRPNYVDPWDPHPDAARAGPAIVVDTLVPLRQTSVRWLETWPGYAQSMLQPWTAAFGTTRVPTVAADGSASFALAGSDLVVEAVYVPVGEWLIGVVGAGPHTEAAALRETVVAVARSLRTDP